MGASARADRQSSPDDEREDAKARREKQNKNGNEVCCNDLIRGAFWFACWQKTKNLVDCRKRFPILNLR